MSAIGKNVFNIVLVVIVLFVAKHFLSDFGLKMYKMYYGVEGMTTAANPEIDGYTLVNSGKPSMNVSEEECKNLTNKLQGYTFFKFSEHGNPNGCVLQNGAPPGVKGIYYNSVGTADCGAFGVSQCVEKAATPAAAPNGYTYTGDSQCKDWNNNYVACRTPLDGTTCSIKATTLDQCASECNKRDSCGEMYFKDGVCYLANGKCVPEANPTNPQPHYKRMPAAAAPAAAAAGGAPSSIVYNTTTNLSAFCGDGSTTTPGKTKMEWKGEDCGDGKIKWNSMKSTSGLRTGLSTATNCSWKRRSDSNWNTNYIGDCGVAPTVLSNLPTNVSQLPAAPSSIVYNNTFWHKTHRKLKLRLLMQQHKPVKCTRTLNTLQMKQVYLLELP